VLPLLAAGCAGLDRTDQGVLQPQTVSGPCHVKKFFLVGVSTTHTNMQVDNPDIQAVLDGALVTGRPAHGQVVAGLINQGRSATIAYAPQPGFSGADRFSVAIEPGDHDIDFAVTVQPGAPKPE
jgi:hypothetical protein